MQHANSGLCQKGIRDFFVSMSQSVQSRENVSILIGSAKESTGLVDCSGKKTA